MALYMTLKQVIFLQVNFFSHCNSEKLIRTQTKTQKTSQTLTFIISIKVVFFKKHLVFQV